MRNQNERQEEMTVQQIRDAIYETSVAMSKLPESAISPEVFLRLFDGFLRAIREAARTKSNDKPEKR